MNIGTVEIPEVDFSIVSHQQRNFRELTLEIFLEDESVVEALREQARYTHLVQVYEPFQSERKFYDLSHDQRNVLQINITCGSLKLIGGFMQISLDVQETAGPDPGYFLTFSLIRLEG